MGKDKVLEEILDKITDSEIIRNTIKEGINIYSRKYSEQQKKDKLLVLCNENIKKWKK